MSYAYKATTTYKRSTAVQCILSASWDTHRDACLAAKLRYELTLEEFNVLVAGGKVRKHGTEIEVDGAEKVEGGQHERGTRPGDGTQSFAA